MAIGFDRERKLVALNDSAELYASLLNPDDSPVTADQLTSVSFTVQAPDESKTTTEGVVQDDGRGYLRYTATALKGHYRAVASFTFTDGEVASTRVDFEVFDPFDPPTPSDTEVVGMLVWHKLEDCFDAEDEGPWLKDMTLNYFNESKMSSFINEALFALNQLNPPTTVTLTNFSLNGVASMDAPLLAQGTFLVVLRHLMRSYTEQPLPQGAQIVYEERRDYPQRWKLIYDIEKEAYTEWAKLWKRQFLQLGHAKGLVDSKAGRLLPAPMRSRNIGRGFF